VDIEHFQPGGVFFGNVANQARTFHVAFRRITFREIDQMRALRAEHVQAQA
jgi:hypothetical protein